MDSDIIKAKNSLRKEIFSEKKKYSEKQLSEWSEQIFLRIEKNNVFLLAHNILIYWSINGEVYTHSFIQKWSPDKQFYLPVISSNTLEIRKYTGLNQMKKNNMFSVLEPTGKILNNNNNIDLAIIPGIAFDQNNNRLGRGKSYYDRFLINYPNYKIGICFPFQFFNDIPADKYDIKMDEVVTL